MQTDRGKGVEPQSLRTPVFKTFSAYILNFTESSKYLKVRLSPPALKQTYMILGEVFVWLKKIRGNDARFQDIMTTLYYDYMLEQKFSSDDIISKIRSLKGVLEPFSTQGDIDLLKRAGFV